MPASSTSSSRPPSSARKQVYLPITGNCGATLMRSVVVRRTPVSASKATSWRWKLPRYFSSRGKSPEPRRARSGVDQREDCVPYFRYLPSSTCGAASCQRAQQLRARAAELNDTGRGIAFVLPVEKVVGVAHFMKPRPEEG